MNHDDDSLGRRNIGKKERDYELTCWGLMSMFFHVERFASFSSFRIIDEAATELNG